MRQSEEIEIFGDIRPVEGFHHIEADNFGAFVWTKGRFRVKKHPNFRYYSVHTCYYGGNETLSVLSNGTLRLQIPLHNGWNTYPIDLSDLDGSEIEFHLSHVVAVSGDSRELGLMIRRFRTVEDGLVLVGLKKALDNKLLNEREYLTGTSALQSAPPTVRISTETQCNIHPGCVYCDYDRIKLQEKESGFTFHVDSLTEMGRFYQDAESICEASIGEPLLSQDLGKLIDRLDTAGKRYEMTSNGILLNSSARSLLLGKNVILSVSIDAASPEGYARYRNDRFDAVTRNLRKLCREKKRHRNLPWVVVPFLAMRSNVHEIPDFLSLMKEVGVDLVKLRSLHVDPYLAKRVVRRNGFVFDYAAETLSLPDLKTLVPSAKREARERDVALIVELDMGEEAARKEAPLCPLPWKTMYAVNYGITTCCFAKTRPLAAWSEREERTLEEYLSAVWNGERFQEIRSALADGRLPEHCLESVACPIVKNVRDENRRDCNLHSR